MKRISIGFLLILACFIVKSQNSVPPDSSKQTVIPESKDMEIQVEYPGGIRGWNRFLAQNLKYPKKAKRNDIQGEVDARFIVDQDGRVSHIEIISGPKELWPAVMDAMKECTVWVPAIQEGKKVTSYKVQPFYFKLAK